MTDSQIAVVIDCDDALQRALPFAAGLAAQVHQNLLVINLQPDDRQSLTSDLEIGATAAGLSRDRIEMHTGPETLQRLATQDGRTTVCIATRTAQIPIPPATDRHQVSRIHHAASALIVLGPAATGAEAIDTLVVFVDGSPSSETALTAAITCARDLQLKLEAAIVSSPTQFEQASDLHARAERLGIPDCIIHCPDEIGFVVNILGAVPNAMPAFDATLEENHPERAALLSAALGAATTPVVLLRA